MLFVLLATLTLWGAISGDEDLCPDSNSVYPCYCDTDFTGFTYLRCERTNDLRRLREILDATKGKEISLGFEKVRFGDIPSDYFDGQKSKDVNFDHCKIGSFGEKPFWGMEDTLERIYIYGSIDKRTKDLETFPLGHLKKLEYLTFEANDIKRLGNDWFESGPESMLQMSLQSNDIEELGDKAFASLINLKQIWLGTNRFKVVKRSMFPNPASNLELLEMSFNGIETIPEDMFTNMPALTDVNVWGNRLVTLPEGTWGNIWNQLNEVYVDRNPLVCDKKILWIFNKRLPQILDGKCAGNNKLTGKDLEDLTAADFEGTY